jgi:hypothetical protein
MHAPPGMKHPKVSEPNKYSGSKSHDAFVTWLNQFLNWLRSNYICGEDTDFARVNLLGNYLKSTALDWYSSEIDNPDHHTRERVIFIDAICGLHHRFVQMATANDAKHNYDTATYNPSDGTEGFYYQLDKYASCMVQQPDDYSFKDRFFDGLPDWIYNRLSKCGIFPKYCTLEDI